MENVVLKIQQTESCFFFLWKSRNIAVLSYEVPELLYCPALSVSASSLVCSFWCTVECLQREGAVSLVNTEHHRKQTCQDSNTWKIKGTMKYFNWLLRQCFHTTFFKFASVIFQLTAENVFWKMETMSKYPMVDSFVLLLELWWNKLLDLNEKQVWWSLIQFI